MNLFSFFIGMAFGAFFTVLLLIVLSDMEENGEIKRKNRKTEDIKTCNRSICMRNEYNGIDCDDCEVRK